MSNAFLDALFARDAQALTLLKEGGENTEKALGVATQALAMHEDTLKQMEGLMDATRDALEHANFFASALLRIADNQPCNYNEHDFCDTHSGHGRPCPWEIANLLAEHYELAQEGESDG